MKNFATLALGTLTFCCLTLSTQALAHEGHAGGSATQHTYEHMLFTLAAVAVVVGAGLLLQRARQRRK